MSVVDDDRHATEEEIVEAIENLSDEQLVALRKKAGFRANSLGHRAGGRDGEYLLTEAMTRTLVGTRRWRIARVDFSRHLDQAMRSIVSNWRKAPDGVVSEADTLQRHQEEPSAVEIEPDPHPDPEKALLAAEELGRILADFASDRDASEVLAGWAEGLKGPEIQELADMSKKEYEAAVKRIRYHVRSGRGQHA